MSGSTPGHTRRSLWCQQRSPVGMSQTESLGRGLNNNSLTRQGGKLQHETGNGDSVFVSRSPAFGLISLEFLLATTTSSCRIVPPLRSHSGMVWLDSSDDTWGTKMVHSTSGVGHMPRSFESTIRSLTVTISDSPASSNNARFLHHKRWRKCTSNIKYSVFGRSILKHILNEYVCLCSYS